MKSGMCYNNNELISFSDSINYGELLTEKAAPHQCGSKERL